MRETPATKMAAIKWQRLIFGTLLVVFQGVYGQPPIPKLESFQPINLNMGSSPTKQFVPFQQANPLLPNDPNREQNYKSMQQAGMTIPGSSNNRQISLDEVKGVLSEEKAAAVTDINVLRLKSFQNNFRQFLELNPDHFSTSKAVYLSESAYYDSDKRPTWGQFEASIEQGANLIRQILKREGLSDKNGTAVNYAIQKLYAQNNEYYDSASQRLFDIPKLRYDFDDYMGDHDWTKMFVTKLLHTGTGQCHSMPLAYLCLTEWLGVKAYLSLAPNHSFVQYFDRNGKRYNFETTNGNLVTQTWLMQSTYVNATALKNNTYLDTLSSRKLYAQCLGDFLLSYLMKTRHYDDFSDQIIKKIFEVDSTNIIALMEQSNRYYTIFQKELQSSGNPPQDKYPNYPELYSAYQNLQAGKQKVERTGFQEMPQDAYQRWLQSLEMEKQKEQNRQEQVRMEQEIRRLKKTNSTLVNKKKD